MDANFADRYKFRSISVPLTASISYRRVNINDLRERTPVLSIRPSVSIISNFLNTVAIFFFFFNSGPATEENRKTTRRFRISAKCSVPRRPSGD